MQTQQSTQFNAQAIQDEKEKRRKETLNLMAAFSEIFKNFANPTGNMQGAIQNFAGKLIGFLVNMFAGVFSKFLGGDNKQVDELAKSVTDAFGRHFDQANALEQQQQLKTQQASPVTPDPTSNLFSSMSFTPAFHASQTDLSDVSHEATSSRDVHHPLSYSSLNFSQF